MIRVGVLRGGISSGYNESLESGAFVLRHLPRERYEPVDVFIDSDGIWHIGGKPVSHESLSSRIDVAWNALNGCYGADGKVEQVLAALGIPCVGAGPLSAAVTMHKKMTKDRLSELGIKTPRGLYVESWGGGGASLAVASVVAKVAHDFSPPWMVEPISRSHGFAPFRAKTRESLAEVLAHMCSAGMPVLIEEEVLGAALNIACVSGFRGQSIYTFFPNGARRGRGAHAAELERVARVVHDGFALGPYSRIEAVAARNGQVCVTRIDTVPSFASTSDIHAALESVGSSFAELSDHVLFSTLSGNRRGAK